MRTVGSLSTAISDHLNHGAGLKCIKVGGPHCNVMLSNQVGDIFSSVSGIWTVRSPKDGPVGGNMGLDVGSAQISELLGLLMTCLITRFLSSQ